MLAFKEENSLYSYYEPEVFQSTNFYFLLLIENINFY